MIAPRIASHLRGGGACLAVAAVLAGSGCAVRLQAPSEPIRFDVNVNITEQKRLEIDQELLALIRQNPELFGFRPSDVAGLPAPDSEAL
ncbi:MAG TPA: hypothetical protein VKQ06_00640 [Gammaproteobacteria bacterium]|nr:hypothetical protein [Gammaproteobacteria bacterium]